MGSSGPPSVGTLIVIVFSPGVSKKLPMESNGSKSPSRSKSIQPLSQRYTRVSQHCYRYESDTGFAAVLDVDDDGLVTSYPKGWERAG